MCVALPALLSMPEFATLSSAQSSTPSAEVNTLDQETAHLKAQAEKIKAQAELAVLVAEAAEAEAESAKKQAAASKEKAVANVTTANTTPIDYSRLGFAPGLAAIYMFDDDVIESASLQNNTVLVSKKPRARIAPILEAHFFFGDGRGGSRDQAIAEARADATGEKVVTNNDAAFGFTTVIELGDDVIRSAGLGFLCSFRKENFRYDPETKSVKISKATGVAYNLGAYLLIEPNVKKLNDGIEEGKDVPISGMDLEKDSEAFGCAIIFSASF